MLDRGIQPIKLFSRTDFDRIIYLSKHFLAKPEVEILLTLIAITDWQNIACTGQLSLNQYIAQELHLDQANTRRYVKHIRDLNLIIPVEGHANAWRLMYYVANRQRLIYNIHEFDGVQTVFNKSNESGENLYRLWLSETEDFRKKNSPSFRALQKGVGATEQVITVKEYEKRMADAKHKFDEDMKLMRTQFKEIIEEMKAENKTGAEREERLARQHDEILGLLKNIASKVDLPSEEQEEVKRHLSLVRSDEK